MASVFAGKSRRGLWLTAEQRSGRPRPPWLLETEPLEQELARREAASRRYHRDHARFGFTSVVTIRNEEMIYLIKLVLRLRDGIGDEETPF